jgi:cell division GTPase FtsZ
MTDPSQPTGEAIAKKVAPDAIIFFGMVNDPEGQGKVGITVIATGIPDNDNHDL